jgi:hypothetical protein
MSEPAPPPPQLTRGVLALRDFAPGEELFRVPLRLAITDHIVNGSAAAAAATAAGEDSSKAAGTCTNPSSSSFDDERDGSEAAAGRSHRAEPSAWGARLACRLLREKARGRASPWAPWLSVLPTTTIARAAKPTLAAASSAAASGEGEAGSSAPAVVVRPGSLRSAWAGALPREVAALLPCPAASRALLAATTAADAEFARLPKAALAFVFGAAAAAAASSSPPSPFGSESPPDDDDETKTSAAMAAYRWARAIVQSRTFGSTAKEEEKSGGGGGGGGGSDAEVGGGSATDAPPAVSPSPPPISLVRMLVPLADFVNHAGDETEGLLSGGRAAPTANAEWKIVADYSSSDEEDAADECDLETGERRGAAARARGRGARPGRGGGFGGVAEGRPPRASPSPSSAACAPPAASSWSLVVSASRALVAGEELSFSYGNRVNADFLVSYGFVPARNPHDAVCLFESAEEAAGWAARRLFGGAAARGGGPPDAAAAVSAAVAAAERETPPSLARAISSSRDPEIVAEARRLWLWAGGRVDERLAAALESVCSSWPSPATAGELVAARAAELLSRSGAPPLSDALGELERAGEHEHEEQHYFRALKRRYAAKEPAVRRSAARASEGAASLADAITPPVAVAPAAPLPPPPPRGGSRSAWRGVRLMALRAGVYSTMILWDALEAADKALAAAKKVETSG